MGELGRVKNKRLFEVKIFHHFWLDQGETFFDALSEEHQEKRLKDYDVRQILTVSPAPQTRKALRGTGAILHNTALGFQVALPEGRSIDLNDTYEFFITVKDPYLANYTALTLAPQKITEIYHKPEKKLYRYKENVPLLSNATGTSRNIGGEEALFLSSEYPAAASDDKAEYLVLSGGALEQLTGDQPGAQTRQIASNASEAPVFVHQGDVPAITPPAGVAGAPAHGIELTPGTSDNLFALIRLRAGGNANAAFDFVNNNGETKESPPVFHIRLKNRSTIWKYISSHNETLLDNPLPLTHYGNANYTGDEGDSAPRRKPSTRQIRPEITTGGKVTQIISEIYV